MATIRPYVDVHAHIGETVSRVPPVGQTVEKYLARMAETNVVAAALCPAAGGPQARGVLDTREHNDAVAAACRPYPGRFPLGLAIVEVRHQRAAVDELERALGVVGLAGFMCHPGLSGHSLGAELCPALEVVDARGGLVLLHVGGGTERRAAEHARRFRHATFIMAHVSMTAAQHEAALEAFGGLENAWFDFAQHPARADASWDIPHLVRHLGADRLLFGSDSPYYDYRLLQAQVEAAPLDEATKDRIAWRNAVELIQRFRPGWEPYPEPPAKPAAYAKVDLWVQQPGTVGRLL